MKAGFYNGEEGYWEGYVLPVAPANGNTLAEVNIAREFVANNFGVVEGYNWTQTAETVQNYLKWGEYLKAGGEFLQGSKYAIQFTKTIGFTSAIKGLGWAGYAANILEARSGIKNYNDGKISGERASYELTGVAASFGASIATGAALGSDAGPWGTVAGIVMGIAFGAVETFYDNVGKPAIDKFTQGMGSMENGLSSGTWMPH